jgi:PAS domain S-box-containing protein
MSDNFTFKKKINRIFSGILIITVLLTVLFFLMIIRVRIKADSLEIIKLFNQKTEQKILEYISSARSDLNAVYMLVTWNKTMSVSNLDVVKFKNFFKEHPQITNSFISLNSSVSDFNDLNNENSTAFLNTEDDIKQLNFDSKQFPVNYVEFQKKNSQNQILISEPFKSIRNNKEELIITLVKQILINNKPAGLIGINYSLANLVQFEDKIINNNKKPQVLILTSSDNIVYHNGNKYLVGQNIMSVQETEAEMFKTILKSKNENIIQNIAFAISEINIPDTETTWTVITNININHFLKKTTPYIYIGIFLLLILIISGIYLFNTFLKKTFKPLNDIHNNISQISQGKVVFKTLEENNEFSTFYTKLNSISEKIAETTEVCKNIAAGNYEKKLTLRGENDKLSLSINEIIDSRNEDIKKNILKEQDTHKQLWMRRGRFEVSEAERKSKNELEELSFNILKTIIKYTDAIIGGIYLYNSEKQSINLIASYAYGNKKHQNVNFKAGEGLVGACIQEKKRIVLNTVPDDYIQIVSGLGSGNPANITIIPIFYQEKINAVLEIAFLKIPEDYVIEFIEQLGDNIGAWIDASLINTKTTELLQISTRQTKDLEEKELILNSKVEELEKIKNEIDIQNNEYKSLMNAVNNTVMVVEYTTEGIVLNSNKKYEEIMGYKAEDIKGISVFELVKQQEVDLKIILENVKNGKPIKQQIKRYTKSGEEKWLSATYTPIYNKDGKISRIIFFAHDITDLSENKFKNH